MEHESRLAGYKYRSDIIEGISQVPNKWLVPDSPENGAQPQAGRTVYRILCETARCSNKAVFTCFSRNSLNPSNGRCFVVLLYFSTEL